MRILFLSLLISLFSLQNLHAQSTIPFVQENAASYTKINMDSIQYIYTESDSLRGEISVFNIFLKNAGKNPLKVNKSAQNAIQLVFDESMRNEEYKIELDKNNIKVTGRQSGAFYGLMSIFQWMTQAPDKGKVVLRNNIHDYPAFQWRGMHLDVSRHFFPTGFIKKYIDILALHKMNTFHWHLTDDQGWRIEIKKYPLLTQIGSKRKESILEKNFEPYLGDGTPVEGFYTQEQIKDVIKYAAQRHVTIVPEIEMPGHAQAALAAYPQYSCDKEPTEVWTKWGVSEKVFCTDDNTVSFLKEILDEVMQLFPSQYIHIGGDEVPKTAWKNCAVCQRNKKQNGLKDENELQSFFIKQIDEYITSKGKRTIGWDEILEGGLAENAAVMSWRGEEGGIAAAKENHYVVMSPGSHCYFDHYQGAKENEPLAIGGYTPIDKVYSYNPVPASLSESDKKYILGAQGNVWTEYMQASSQVEYMAVPRVCALAEVLWTGSKKPGFDNFKNRLRTHFNTLDKYHIYYSDVVYNVKADEKNTATGTEIKLLAPYNYGKILYTTDGNQPDKSSLVYDINKPVILTKNVVLKAQYFEKDKALGKILEIRK